MYILVEQWNPTAKWLAADAAQRQAFLAGVGGAIAQLTALGAEILSFSANDTDTSHRADFAWLAVWRFPNLQISREFESAVQASGWYDYFEQSNMRGAVDSPQTVMGKLLVL
jgi:haloalkane dehalogenase